MKNRTSNVSSLAVAVNNPKLNYFDKSHYVMGSANLGYMYPVHVENVLPGSHHRISYEHMLRMLPLVSPAVQDLYVEFRTFYVRNDILWDGWKPFIAGPEPGITTSVPPMPRLEVLGSDANRVLYTGPRSLSYHLGFRYDPQQVVGTNQRVQLNALRFMAYQKIWWEYFRDANNDTVTDYSDPGYFGENRKMQGGILASGAVTQNLMTLRSACWKQDYFTTTLPSAQRGSAVSIPNPGTIEDLGRATRLQRLAQLSNRIGGRYREYLKGEFGVIPSDDSLDIPQFIGGSTSRFTIGEVLQTSATDPHDIDVTPLGEMGGHGIVMGRSNNIDFHADHHGVLMTLMFIRPGSLYGNTMDRELLKTSRFDYGTPDLAQLGDQITDRRELNANAAWTVTPPALGLDVLGYQAMYEEYRQQTGHINGDLADSLRFWHQGRFYGAGAVTGRYSDQLSATFNRIAHTPGSTFLFDSQLYRIFAYTGDAADHIVYELFCHHSAGQPLPAFSDPSFEFYR